jgi:carbonic anhydrase/acetyltransferase-like protein (isoleucine patch superfamily)
MPIRFRKTAAGVYVAHSAVATGDVTFGAGTSLWFGAVVRGDVAPVRIGARVNIQDNAVIHCDSGVENQIADDVTIGHSAVVHGAVVGRGSLIGMSATVLGQTRIGVECLVAAGAVVSPGTVVPDGHLIMGVPGKVVRPVTDKERAYMKWLTAHYVELAEKYATVGFVDPLAG